MSTDPLAQPLVLPSGLSLKNRIAKAAMTENLAEPDRGDPNERHARLYARWAEGGAGLLVTGNVMIDRRFLERSGNIVMDEESDPAALARFARAATLDGARALVQLSHPGRQTSRFIAPVPVAPSAVPAVRAMASFGRPRALDASEIEALVERFAAAAAACEAAGFHGVQLHAAHGYLISQFLSPLTNLRSDRWGGDLDGRARFLLSIVRAIRARTRPGFALSVKLNTADFQRGGFDCDDAVRVAAMLESEGIDLLEISGGSYEKPAMMGSESARTQAREAYFLEQAMRLREAVRTPLMLTGGLRSRAAMQAVVRDGAVDVVGLARPLALDAELPHKLLSGSVEGSPAAPVRLGVRVLDAAAEAGVYGMHIARMADGLEPRARVPAWRGAFDMVVGEILRSRRRRQATV